MVTDKPPSMGPQPKTRPATFEEAHAIVTGKWYYDDVEATGPEWPFPDWGTVHDKDEPTKEVF